MEGNINIPADMNAAKVWSLLGQTEKGRDVFSNVVDDVG